MPLNLIQTILVTILLINTKSDSHYIGNSERGNLKQKFNDLRSNGLLTKDGEKDFRRQNRDQRDDWRGTWREHWNHIKGIVTKYNATRTDLGGDRVNMVAARPWGVPCGDPNHHDLPWGTCTLPMECESEFRIFRGDYFCGNTEFVCCGMLLHNYDMFHGLADASLDATSLQTDSEELRSLVVPGDRDRNRASAAKRRRKRVRRRRKRLIQKLIRDTVRDIGRLLNRTYRFGTRVKRKRTEQIKEFILHLKRLYQRDRQSVQDMHQLGLHKVDTSIYHGIHAIRILNKQLVYNNSIHKWVVCGYLNRREKRILKQRYPFALDSLLETNDTRASRRDNLNRKMFDFDIEYGLVHKQKGPLNVTVKVT